MKRHWRSVSLVVVMAVVLLTPLAVSAGPNSPNENPERYEHKEIFNQYDFVSPERVPDWLLGGDPSIRVYNFWC